MVFSLSLHILSNISDRLCRTPRSPVEVWSNRPIADQCDKTPTILDRRNPRIPAVPIARLRAHIAAQGWSLAEDHVFQDAGYSGLVFERPGLEALLDALQRGEFVRLVTEHPDTLSRTLADRWYVENTAARMGCRIVYLDEQPSAPLVIGATTGLRSSAPPSLVLPGKAEPG